MSGYNYFNDQGESAAKDDFDLESDTPSSGVKSKALIGVLVVSFVMMIKDLLWGAGRAKSEPTDGDADLSVQENEIKEMPGRMDGAFKLVSNEQPPVKASNDLDNNVGSAAPPHRGSSGQVRDQPSPSSNVVPFKNAQGANQADATSNGSSKASVITTNDSLDFRSIANLKPTVSASDSLDVGDKVEDETNEDDIGGNSFTNRLPVVTAPLILGQLHVNNLLVISFSDLLENSFDFDNDQLSIENLTASSGTLEQSGPTSWTFTPEEEGGDDVEFSYEISDGTGAVSQSAVLEILPPAGKVIEGSADNDVLTGTAYDDVVIGRAGNDLITADNGDDIIFGGDGDDEIYAGEGDDIVYGGAGDDLIDGGSGDDELFGDDGDDKLFGESGNDELVGGAGDDELTGGEDADVLDGGSGNDLFLATISDGNDHYSGGLGADTYDISDTNADALVDLSQNTAISDDIGEDWIEGIENVVGGSGDDVIVANDEVNVLSGGAGEDVFVFNSATDAGAGDNHRDQITDLEVGDRIDISHIDGDETQEGNQSFQLIQNEADFTQAGQIRTRYEYFDDEEHTIIEGNTDEDDDVEFEIELDDHHDLDHDYFIGVS